MSQKIKSKPENILRGMKIKTYQKLWDAAKTVLKGNLWL